MNKLLIIFLFLSLTVINFLLTGSIPLSVEIENPGGDPQEDEKQLHVNDNNLTYYNFQAELLPDRKLLTVDESIMWINRSSLPAEEIFIHLYPNAFNLSNKYFSPDIIADMDQTSRILINSLVIGDKGKNFEYYCDGSQRCDSTLIRISPDKTIAPGDSLSINIQYSLKIPISSKGFGYSTGRNFFFISEWYPRVGMLTDTGWNVSPYYPLTGFHSEFSDYYLRLTVPPEYTAGGTGSAHEIKSADKKEYIFALENVPDMAFFATDNILRYEKSHSDSDDNRTLIELYIQPERIGMLERYFNAVSASLDYMSRYIGVFPFRKLTLVDVPRTGNNADLSYPAFITVSSPLISPPRRLDPEGIIARRIANQYFSENIAFNEIDEAWLGEGLSAYFGAKILDKYYGEQKIYFNLASYYPVLGMNFLSYREIPIVYTLGSYFEPSYASALELYYMNNNLGSVSDRSRQLPTRLSYRVNTIEKPKLMFLCLDNYLGEQKLLSGLRNIFDHYRFRHLSGEELIASITADSGEDLDWFFEGVYRDSKNFDYSVNMIKKVDEDRFSVLVERRGDGVFKSIIALYTDSDTLFQTWDGKEKWKTLFFTTGHEVIGAEIDPERINLFDSNFSNNSLLLESDYWAPVSLAIKWFFWMQNALMVLGSIG